MTCDGKDPEKESLVKSSDDSRLLKTIGRRRIGLFIALLVALSRCVSDVIVKMVQDRYGPLTLAASRYLIQTLLVVPFYLCKRNESLQSIPKLTLVVLLVCALLRAGSTLPKNFAMTYISVSDMKSLTATKQVQVIIMSCLFNRRSIGCYDIFVVLLSFGSVFLVCRPTFITSDESSLGMVFGCFLAFLAAFMTSTYTCAVHNAGSVPVRFLLIFQSLALEIICVAPIIATGEFDALQNLTSGDCALMILSGLLSFISIGVGIFGIRMIKPHEFEACNSLEIVFAFIFQYALIGIVPDVLGTIGSFVMIIAVILLALKSQIIRFFTDRICTNRNEEQI